MSNDRLIREARQLASGFEAFAAEARDRSSTDSTPAPPLRKALPR